MSNLSQKLQKGIQSEMQNLKLKELALNPATVKRLLSDQRKLRAGIVSLQVSLNEQKIDLQNHQQDYKKLTKNLVRFGMLLIILALPLLALLATLLTRTS
ncbi:hypothetical protein ATI02_4730 [Pseudomonas baetica]|uniref:Uncharacterized protein n=1 Tax=Pseudomonas baetica TaxID=674054 RepID=A0ABX4Q4M1_9PSED|nr:hypothetical protein ATI02_4730 [Pseudomonas baetica]